MWNTILFILPNYFLKRSTYNNFKKFQIPELQIRISLLKLNANC